MFPSLWCRRAFNVGMTAGDRGHVLVCCRWRVSLCKAARKRSKTTTDEAQEAQSAAVQLLSFDVLACVVSHVTFCRTMERACMSRRASMSVRNVSFKNLPKSLPVPCDPRAHRGSRHRKNSDTQFVSRRRIGSTAASPHKSVKECQIMSTMRYHAFKHLQTSSVHHLFITSFILEFHGSELSASMLWTGGWTVVKVPSKLVTASAGACRCAALRGIYWYLFELYPIMRSTRTGSLPHGWHVLWSQCRPENQERKAKKTAVKSRSQRFKSLQKLCSTRTHHWNHLLQFGHFYSCVSAVPPNLLIIVAVATSSTQNRWGIDTCQVVWLHAFWTPQKVSRVQQSIPQTTRNTSTKKTSQP